MNSQHIVIVTGWRDYPQALRRIVDANLNSIYVRYGNFVLLHGACTKRGSDEMVGADRYADDWAQTVLGIDLRRRPADWSLGNRGGPIRNRQMVREAMQLAPVDRIHGLAFPGPGSRGTIDCIGVMKAFGIEVDVWDVTKARQWLAGLGGAR
jgi:hypothetical protein